MDKEVTITEGAAAKAAPAVEQVKVTPTCDVFIAGSHGQIGGTLYRRLINVPGFRPFRLEADVRDYKALAAEVNRHMSQGARHGLAVFVNAAAIVGTIACDVAGNEAYEVNVNGALNMYRLARRVGGHLFQLSTTAIYDPMALRPYREDSPIRPHTRYGHTKAEAELRLRDAAVSRDSDCGITFIRPCFCYGGAEDRVSTVKGLVDAALGRRPFIVQLNREKRKDWMHIEDFTAYFIRLIDWTVRFWNNKTGHCWAVNIASGKPEPFGNVVNFLNSIEADGVPLYPKYAIERPADDYLGDHVVATDELIKAVGRLPTSLSLMDWLNDYLKARNLSWKVR